ncbi:MAG: signal recognition particle protein [Lachnospiraceae bacterium]|nr:signal recognition particle protein [Candidatus Darwinimomas equi]
MAFENLSEKLQNVFKSLRGKGRLTEDDVRAGLKEVRMALLEADVNFKVVKQFIKTVEERAVGSDVLESLTPGQQVIKIVNEELVNLMGGEGQRLVLKPTMVIMMAGLQGAGKTTTAAKLAGKFKSQGRRPLLVACDVYRPAAIDQLKKNGEKVGVPVFSMGTDAKPEDIVKAAMQYAKENSYNVVIIDTAGRLHIDDDMMAELAAVKKIQDVDATLLTVDAMTGQDAVNVASEFADKVGIDGVILTKLDGDARGGAALSIKAVTDKPIYYAGMGEKLTDLEEFHPDRMAGRILGMGDMLTLIEKAQENFDEEQARKTAAKLKKSEFDFNDYLDAMAQMKKMGGLGSIMSMLPGMGGKNMPEIDEKQFEKISSMIYSMTPEERANPKLLNPSRRNRIAKGCGQDIASVNRVVKQFEQMKKMQKQLNGMMNNKHGNRNLLGGLKQWL